ncbi:DUF72 domain-containing protein [Paenibacillus xerothermodurans]|uniref:DUF72 domain-containing protein n=1 Tax=Paenibacillus xerothermodurans TaxID=1977292 RepID=A0A2W1N833_PAEXE|nr:DUF72 domain-containing protein [Paenibacillus xerothermodurans]PZE20557.1 DUF72 domain-containing protein [Paenibacillus xerothermodurans]
MIHIGLTGFGDHQELYGKIKPSERLAAYSQHFSFVELDNPFYAVQPVKHYVKWVSATPPSFGFVVKAYQGMTFHLRGKDKYFDSTEAMYEAFHESIQPVIDAGKLTAVLFQYPPWFDCSRQNVALLRETRERMRDLPCALEFRHQSWFEPEMRERTLDFMREEGWIHTVVDEPQAGAGTIPIVPVATRPDITYVRLHGRNVKGWQHGSHPEWRKQRYLYRYSTKELEEWRDRLLQLEQSCGHIYVVFNNNSGGDAADNAKELSRMLGLHEHEQARLEQVVLFDDT